MNVIYYTHIICLQVYMYTYICIYVYYMIYITYINVYIFSNFVFIFTIYLMFQLKLLLHFSIEKHTGDIGQNLQQMFTIIQINVQVAEMRRMDCQFTLSTMLTLPSYFYLFVYCFLGPHLWHMVVPRLGVESELQLLANATPTAMPDLSHVHHLHHSSWQHQILNPLSEARNRTHVLMDTSQVYNPLSHNGNSKKNSLYSSNSI